MIEHDTVSWVSVIILSLAVVGVASNIACVVILIVKKRSSMFHKLLKILSFYDTLVIIGCSFLYALPGTWSYFTYVIYPVALPYVLPLTQISVMSSVYCTTLMSFERYARICYICQLRSNKLLSERAFKIFVVAVAIFPIIFYVPKFFEVRTEKVQRIHQVPIDCSRYSDLIYQFHRTNSSAYREELELLLNMTNTNGFVNDEIISSKELLVLCLQADYSSLLSSNHTLFLDRNITTYQLIPTSLRQSVTYYQVYSICLNTLFATLLPVILLFYLNMSTVKALAQMKQMEQENEQETIGLKAGVVGVPAILITRSKSDQTETLVSTVERISSQAEVESNSKEESDVYSCNMESEPVNPLNTSSTSMGLCEIKLKGRSNSFSNRIKTGIGSIRSKNDYSVGDFDVSEVETAGINKAESDDENASRKLLNMPKGERKRGSFKALRAQIDTIRHQSLSRSSSAAVPGNGHNLRPCVASGGQAQPTDDRHHKTEDRLTRISMSIVWIFLFCHVWKLIPTIYEAVYSGETQVLTDWPKWLLIVNDISHSLIVFNSAVNFLIYVVL